MPKPGNPEDTKRLMTRTSTGRKRRLMTRCSALEYEAWATAAKKEGLTIGPWSRMRLNRAVRNLGIRIPTEYEAWSAAAENADLTVGQWSRRVLNQAVRELERACAS